MTTPAPRGFSARTSARDAAIRRFGRAIDQWSRGAMTSVLGALTANWGNAAQVLTATDRVLTRLPDQAAKMMEDGLEDVLAWSFQSAAATVIRSLPLTYWRARARAELRRYGVLTERWAEPSDRDPVRRIVYLQRILDGDLDADEIKELVRRLEFPPPSVYRIRQILTQTNAHDGLSAMQRIKTIVGRDNETIRRLIQSQLSAPAEDQASALQSLSVQIRPFFADQEGINYKAQRIARTESVRVAEEGLRASYEEVSDVVDGIQWFSARLPQSRPDHVARHEKIYWRQPSGRYVADDGETLPPIPLGPNCLCWTAPVWDKRITAGAPAADYGPAYRKAEAEFAATA